MSGLGGGFSLGKATFYIDGDASGASNAATQANNSLAGMESAVAQNWWGLKNLGLAFAALPAAVAAGVGESVKQASQLQDAMVNVARTADLMGESNKAALDALQQQLFDIGKIRATPTLEILGIAESAGALGVANSDIAAFTQTVVDLVSTTDLTSQAASVGLARLAALTGTTAGGFDNLASSILTTGVDTAATETDILAMSQRLAGLGAALGLNASQIIGWSAAILSAGIRTAEGATQIQKTFIDITRAVSKGGADLQAFANIAGVSSEELKTTFNASASDGLLQIVTGLGNVVTAGGDFVRFLDDAGIKEQRQVRLLLQLAAAQANNANEHAKASYILNVAAEGYSNLERYQSAVEARNATLSARIQEFRNVLFQTGATIGTSFIGPLTSVIGVLQTLALGFGALSGPIKAFGLVVFGLATVASALGAVFFLLGPRLVIAWESLQRLGGATTTASGGLQRVAQSTQAAEISAQEYLAALDALNQAQQRQAEAAMRAAQAIAAETGFVVSAQEVMIGLEGQTYKVATAQNAAAASSGRFSGFLRGVMQAGIATMAIMVGITAYTYALGKAQQNLEQKQANAQKANSDLTAEMRRSGQAINQSTTSLLGALPTYQRVSDEVTKLGVSQTQLLAIIQNPSAGKEWQNLLDKVNSANGAGSDSTKQITNDVVNLRKSWQNSAGDAGVATTAIQTQTGAMADLGSTTQETATELNKFRDAQIAIAQAFTDYIDATLAADSADAALEESAKSLAEAQAKAADATHYVTEAEWELAAAQLDSEQAARRLADAQQAVDRAREIAANRVLDAEGALADSQAKYQDDLDSVAAAQKALNDLQTKSVVTQEQLLKATNKLTDARLKLQHATLEVSDLEQNLAYLIQQGAGARDIQEAQLALADGVQAVADAQDNVNDAQKELADLKDPVKRAQAIEKAEKDLAKARRDASEQLRTIKKNEQELADARQRQADDTDYKDAQDALAQAHVAQEKAIDSVKDATQALGELRNGSLTREAQAKERAYEQQLLATAKAHVEVTKQTVLMNGGTWDAGQAAHALADELGALNVKTQEAIDKRAEWIKALEQAPNIPPEAKGGSGAGGVGGVSAPDLGDLGGIGAGDGGVGIPPEDIQKAKTRWQDILLGIVSGSGAFLAAQLAIQLGSLAWGAIFGGAAEEGAVIAAEGLGTTLGSTIALAIGAVLVTLITGYVLVRFYDSISGWLRDHPLATILLSWVTSAFGGWLLVPLYTWGGTIIPAIVSGAKTGWGLFTEFASSLPDTLIGFMEDLPERIGGIFGGVSDRLTSFIGDFGPRLIGFIAALPGQLAYGLGFVSGLIIRVLFIEPVQAAINFGPAFLGTIIGIFTQIPGIITGAISSIPGIISGIFSAAKDAMEGPVREGVANVVGFFYDLPGRIIGFISGIPEWLGGWFGSMGEWAYSGFTHGIAALWQWFADLPSVIYNYIKDLPSRLWNGFWDMAHNAWEGFKDGLGINSPSYISEALDDIVKHMGTSVDAMNDHLSDLANMKVDPFAAIADQMSKTKDLLNDHVAATFTAGLQLDPFTGLAVNPGVYNAGQTVTNNYNDTINQDITTDADPNAIINEWAWAKRLRSRA